MSTKPLTPKQLENLKNFIRYIFREVVEPFHREMLVRSICLETIKRDYPHLSASLDSLLDAAREGPEVQELMHNEYHVTLENMLQSTQQSSLDAKFFESILEHWKGPLN
jgi:hypothetical protein